MHTEPVHAGTAGLVSTPDTGLCTIHRGRTLTAQAHPCATTDLPLVATLELPVCSQRARSDGEGVDGGDVVCALILLAYYLADAADWVKVVSKSGE